MDSDRSDRRTAVGAGVLFIVATVASVVGTSLSSPLLGDPNYLHKVSANPTQVSIGALFELIAAGSCVGIAVALYPVLKRWNATLALASVVFRGLEAVMYLVAVVSLLSLLELSRKYNGPAGRRARLAAGDW